MRKPILTFVIAGLTAGSLALAGNRAAAEQPSTARIAANEEVLQRDTLDEDYRESKKRWEARIQKNEMRIAELRQKIEKDKSKMRGEYNKKLIDLEATNNRLKRKVAEYKRDTKEGWQSFKSELNHDMDELGSALKNFVTNDKP